jgi:UDP-hydrolysing UDP-N-acetyl-D-glucosamine 2-epimerase
MRKICVVVGSRANYSSIKSVMRAVDEHPGLELVLVAGASALLDRYGKVVEVMERDGFRPAARVNMIVEGETPLTMAKSTGLGLLELPTVFDQLRPDCVVTVGDRFETMATAVAASYMNIPLAHTMGGEVTGTIDESIRHAVTKLAHLHFPANRQAAERIVKMGEEPSRVHTVGCPRIDLVAEIAAREANGLDRGYLLHEGVGGHLDLDRPFLLVSQHPVTTEYTRGEEQVHETLMAINDLAMPTIMLWPNADAGSEDVARGIRKFRERHSHEHIRFYKNFPVETFVRLMMRCAVMVGNSSAAVREGAYLGVPAVNVGSRQAGRERGGNVLDAGYERGEIMEAVRRQLEHGRYGSLPVYGDGNAGRRIADILAGGELPPPQKRITY